MFTCTQKQNLSDETGKQTRESAFGAHPHRPNAENMLRLGHATGEMTRPAVQSVLCAEFNLWHQGCLAFQSQRPCQGVMRNNSWKKYERRESRQVSGILFLQECFFALI